MVSGKITQERNSKVPKSAMNPEFEKAVRGMDWLSALGQPMLYDGELYVLRRNLEPGFDTYRWYKGVRLV